MIAGVDLSFSKVSWLVGISSSTKLCSYPLRLPLSVWCCLSGGTTYPWLPFVPRALYFMGMCTIFVPYLQRHDNVIAFFFL